MIDRDRVRAAHADAWEVEGLARTSYGGGATRVRDTRLMASGLPFPQWNNADVTGPDPDISAIETWYRERDVPWGVRVPIELPLDFGAPLFVKRCFGLERSGLQPVGRASDVVARRADPEELERLVAAEAALFGAPIDVARNWIAPVFGRPGFEHWIAVREAEAAAIGTAVWSNGEAGRAVMLTGLATAAPEPAALLDVLAGAMLGAIFDAESDVLAHCHASSDSDASGFVRLGFTEVPGFQVRVVRER